MFKTALDWSCKECKTVLSSLEEFAVKGYWNGWPLYATFCVACGHKSYCSRCKTTNGPLIITSRRGGRTYYYCRPCNAARANAYYKTPQGKERVVAGIKKAIDRNPERQRARRQVYYAVLRGELDRPEKCPTCDKKGRIQAHHHDYSKPLDVQWACQSCHADIHRLENPKAL